MQPQQKYRVTLAFSLFILLYNNDWNITKHCYFLVIVTKHQNLRAGPQSALKWVWHGQSHSLINTDWATVQKSVGNAISKSLALQRRVAFQLKKSRLEVIKWSAFKHSRVLKQQRHISLISIKLVFATALYILANDVNYSENLWHNYHQKCFI